MLVREKPVSIAGQFEAGRPAGVAPGTQLWVPLGLNFGAIPLPGQSALHVAALDQRRHEPDLERRLQRQDRIRTARCHAASSAVDRAIWCLAAPDFSAGPEAQ